MKKSKAKGPKAKALSVADLGITEHDTADVKIRTPGGAKRNEAYMGVIAKLEKYKKAGKSFTINVPKGRTIESLHHSFNSIFSRHRPQMAAGLAFKKGTTEDGKIVFSIIKESEKKNPGGRPKGGTSKAPKPAAKTPGRKVAKKSKPRSKPRASASEPAAASGGSAPAPATLPGEGGPEGQ